jgi:hypothetical protein
MVSDNGVGSKLMVALIAAKKKFKPLVKNKVNPHFKSRYADLEAVKDATEDALLSEGLFLTQRVGFDEKEHLGVITDLKHISGEAMPPGFYPLPGGVKPQELASAITYGRRISKCAMLDLVGEDDDDGEATEGRSAPPQKRETPKPEKPAEKAKDAPAAGNHWIGAVVEVNSPKNGTWKVKGGDAAASEFGTATPEHAAVANDAKANGTRVSIKFTVQASNGVKRILSIEPVKEENDGK